MVTLVIPKYLTVTHPFVKSWKHIQDVQVFAEKLLSLKPVYFCGKNTGCFMKQYVFPNNLLSSFPLNQLNVKKKKKDTKQLKSSSSTCLPDCQSPLFFQKHRIQKEKN